ncbi:MAG TPA: hypothetical protein VFB12_30660, partial [Ktedonobacteraceae bacterium]|nr:hypothetical protein [Ktedonobacteraceae bacterium]
MESLDASFVVAVPIGDIRRDPDDASELVTQALMNTSALLGEVSGEWTHVILSDYSGWIRTDELAEPIVRGYCSKDEGVCGVALPYSVVVTVAQTPLYASETGDEMLAEVYLATALPYIDLAHPQRLRVALAGNSEGWLVRDDVEVRSNADLFPRQDIRVVTSYAKSLLGVPYLWGGTSCRG